jgi:Putative carbonic anhydrase
MARALRIEYEGANYRAMARGQRRDTIVTPISPRPFLNSHDPKVSTNRTANLLKASMAEETFAYLSSAPYEAERIYAAAVYCSDGRLGDHIDEFLHKGLGLPRYDRVACPGGPVALAGRLTAHWECRGVEEQLKFLSQVHEIRRVILIAHSGCAYYSGRLAVPAERLEAEQRQDLQKAQRAVERLIPGIDVTQFFAHVIGTEVAFQSLCGEDKK